ncbi:hypothetical protein [Streptomyces spectabilis]|uniref:ATP-binding protein n=1 Tax=Streptomyces spectabilis TaxID=68270 RepID=A0A5P2XLJ1_STRST|nr:hypothetical protein [Streptomyces spectabilis]MBB5102102.1 hypothetical protein [Streptomyces spectabilis]MCI3907152.1 hypothetical protein [Streptomyces spectabilis]QEV63910.1 hypothetical protein CP982_38755 [Streptomyces spectabilis]GGV28776.1 hypothetical protein GCM10010245_46770 [Streptomyces spectabilis]
MPTAVHRPVDLTRARGARLPRLCLAVEVGRAPRTQMLLGEAAQCLLTAIGAPPVLARRAAEVARLGADYVAGHSERPRCRLWVHTDPDGVTLTITDFAGTSPTGQPAWLPASPADQEQPLPVPRHTYGQREVDEHDLALHLTPEGHLRFAFHACWPGGPSGAGVSGVPE